MAETEPIFSQESGEEQGSEIKPVENLEELPAKIEQLKERGSKKVAVLLEKVNPSHLTDEDVEFFNAFATGKVDELKFRDYQDRIFQARNQKKDNPGQESREIFSSCLYDLFKEQNYPKNKVKG